MVTGNHGASDYWIVKLDIAGNVMWQKSLGGNGLDVLQSISLTSDGGYIAAGSSRSVDGDVTNGFPTGIPWVVKLTATGEIICQKSYGSRQANFPVETLYSIEQTTDGGYIASGNCWGNGGDVTGNHGGGDYWLIKLDSAGNLIWQQCFGGSANEDFAAVASTNDGGYILTGLSASNNGQVTLPQGSTDCWVVKVSSVGSLSWQRSLGGSAGDGAVNVKLTSDGGYILAGGTRSSDGEATGNHGGADLWVVKLAPDPLPVKLTPLKAIQQNSSVLCTWQTLQEQNSSHFTIERSNDAMHYSPVGNVAAAGNSDLPLNYSFTDKDVFAGGKDVLYYRLKMVDKDGSFAYSNIASVKLKYSFTLSVYPNPVIDQLFIDLVSPVNEKASLTITDHAGKKFYKQDVLIVKGKNSVPVNTSMLPNGEYILSVEGKNKYSGRFIKVKE